MYQWIRNVPLWNDWSKITYSQVHGFPVLKALILQNCWWTSATRIGELLRFGKIQKLREIELSVEKNLVLHWRKISYFVRKFCFSYILDFAKTVWALQILLQKFTGNFAIKELWAMENHVLVNMLLCSSHFTEVY